MKKYQYTTSNLYAAHTKATFGFQYEFDLSNTVVRWKTALYVCAQCRCRGYRRCAHEHFIMNGLDIETKNCETSQCCFLKIKHNQFESFKKPELI